MRGIKVHAIPAVTGKKNITGKSKKKEGKNMFESFKKANTIGIETAEKLTFTKLAEHVGEELKIYGFFFNASGKYGESVTVITSPETGVNLPKRYVQNFKELTDEEITAITSGRVTLVNIRPIETKSGESTAFEIKVD